MVTGIPDFRGEHGVWTLEEQGHPLPEYERCWDNAMPTLAHMALVGLMNRGLVHSIISQNVDGEMDFCLVVKGRGSSSMGHSVSIPFNHM